MNDWLTDWLPDWLTACLTDLWVKACRNEWMNESQAVSQSVSQSVGEWVSESVSQSVKSTSADAKIPFCLFYFWGTLAVYNRSLQLSAYKALRDLKILQLPHSKTLKQIIKDGSEKDGIDDEYLYGQNKTYIRYQKEREEEGHPRPLGVGVMMWDEVKVRISIYTQFQG